MNSEKDIFWKLAMWGQTLLKRNKRGIMAEYPIGLVLTFENKEYVVIKIQPEGIRLRGTKNNPLGERFEMVVNETLDRPIYLSCPFCGVEDFDLVGLKIHLSNGWCNEFNGLERSWNEIVVNEKEN